MGDRNHETVTHPRKVAGSHVTSQLPLYQFLQNRRSCVGDFEKLDSDLLKQPTLGQSVQLGLAPPVLRAVSYAVYKFLFLLSDRLAKIMDLPRQSTVMGNWHLPFVVTAARVRATPQPL